MFPYSPDRHPRSPRTAGEPQGTATGRRSPEARHYLVQSRCSLPIGYYGLFCVAPCPSVEPVAARALSFTSYFMPVGGGSAKIRRASGQGAGERRPDIAGRYKVNIIEGTISTRQPRRFFEWQTQELPNNTINLNNNNNTRVIAFSVHYIR